MTRAEARALVERQARAWEAEDLDAIVADFAEDGELVSPGGRWVGEAAVRAAAAAFFRVATDVRAEVTTVLIDGDDGAVEWHWSYLDRSTGRRVGTPDGILFSLRDGRITSWREYFDTALLATPLPEETR